MTSKNRFKLIPAVYLILRRNDDVLLLKRANTGYQDGRYSFVAGHLDGDELAIDGMMREAKEEAGIIVAPSDLRLVHTTHRLSRGQSGQERIDLFFEATEWQGEVTNMEPGKCSELAWFSVQQLPEATIPLIKLVLTDIAKGITYSQYDTEPEG